MLCFFLEVAYLYVRLLTAVQWGVRCRAVIPSGDKPPSPRGKPGPCPRAVVSLHSCQKAQDTRFYSWPLITEGCFHLNRTKWASVCVRGRNLPLFPVTGTCAHSLLRKVREKPYKETRHGGPLHLLHFWSGSSLPSHFVRQPHAPQQGWHTYSCWVKAAFATWLVEDAGKYHR